MCAPCTTSSGARLPLTISHKRPGKSLFPLERQTESVLSRVFPALALSLLVVPASAQSPAPSRLPASAQAKIEAILRDPNLQSAHVGIAVVALGRSSNTASIRVAPFAHGLQPLLYSHDGDKRFIPASNFKLFTAAWALESLGASYAFQTRAVLSPLRFGREGVWPLGTPLPLALTLDGDGDPSLTGDDLKALADRVAASPLVKGQSLIVRVAPSRFGAEENGRRYPDGWTIDDTIWYYGAPITGWALDRNQIDVTITGTKPGMLADMKVEGEMPFSIFNGVLTAPDAQSSTGAHFDRGDRSSPLGPSLSIGGTVAPGSTDAEGVAVPDPNEWIRARFITLLQARGVSVANPNAPFVMSEGQLVASHTSAPLGTILQRFLKSSDNLYGEMLLRAAATRTPQKKWPQVASTGLAARSHGAMLDWLSSKNMPVASLRMSDGCGLSRYDIVTPIAITRLLALEAGQKDGAAFYSALPIAGIDGTLKNRMKNTPAQGNARAKTGTFSIVNCLSGYVTTRDNVRLAVSVLTNFAPDGDAARERQGQIFAALADTKWTK
ncbi:D-alanyl-D-alanine carboxypeptidase [Abditibacteriota bacterium]|nr:D-alanyl-D-alanine carboxypeptidase [Abditibacteriota bacterium]